MNVVPFPTNPLDAPTIRQRRSSSSWARPRKAGQESGCGSNVILLPALDSRSAVFPTASVVLTNEVLAQVKSELASAFNLLLVLAILLTALGIELSDNPLRLRVFRDSRIEGPATVSLSAMTFREAPPAVSRSTGATA